MDKINSALQNLQSNPLFQMSLGSKELFHSNFLAWIIESSDEFAKLFFHQLSIVDESEFNSIKLVEREKFHLDLLIYIGLKNGREKLIVIENKIKSLPYPSQLQSYYDKIEKIMRKKDKTDKVFILFSLTQPTFKLPKPWILCDYQQIYNALNETSCVNFQGNKFLSLNSIIDAYKDFILNLTQITNDVMSFNSYNFYYPNEHINYFRKIRIHDLFLKLKHQQIAKDIISVLEANSTYAKEKLKSIKDDFYNDLDYCVNVGFTNSTGITDFKVLAFKANDGSHIYLGIQLQGNQFRYVSEINTDNKEFRSKHVQFALELSNKGIWLLDGDSILNILDVVTFKKGVGKGRSNKNFCSYDNNRFLYKYDYLTDKNSLETIIKGFDKSAQYIASNLSTIQDLAKKYFTNPN